MINIKIQKQTAVFTTLALALGVVTASIYWYLNPKIKQIVISNSNQPAKTECNKKICVDSLDELWVEYKDEKYGFSFMYPEKIMEKGENDFTPDKANSYLVKNLYLNNYGSIDTKRAYSTTLTMEIYEKVEGKSVDAFEYAKKEFEFRKQQGKNNEIGVGYAGVYSDLERIDIQSRKAYSFDFVYPDSMFLYGPYKVEKFRAIFIDLDNYILVVNHGRDIVTNQIVDSLKFTIPNNAAN